MKGRLPKWLISLLILILFVFTIACGGSSSSAPAVDNQYQSTGTGWCIYQRGNEDPVREYPNSKGGCDPGTNGFRYLRGP